MIEPETGEAPPMSALDINAPTILGLDVATAGVIKIWREEGEFLPPRYDEETRQNILGWPDNGTYTVAIRQIVVHSIQAGRWQKADEEKKAAMQRRHAAAQARKAAISGELAEIREALNMSQSDMADLIGAKLNLIHEAESRGGGSYSTERLEDLLRQYQAFQKLRGSIPAEAQGIRSGGELSAS
jgi:DNA-binding transcriptional regulator YiaG